MVSRRVRLLALGWFGIAILLRVYGAEGGDAAIVGGLLFLIWTAPIGPIWQFYLYDRTLVLLPSWAAQIVGDTTVLVTCVLFWFLWIPRLRRYLLSRSERDMPRG
jgi:hypothetical protein